MWASAACHSAATVSSCAADQGGPGRPIPTPLPGPSPDRLTFSKPTARRTSEKIRTSILRGTLSPPSVRRCSSICLLKSRLGAGTSAEGSAGRVQQAVMVSSCPLCRTLRPQKHCVSQLHERFDPRGDWAWQTSRLGRSPCAGFGQQQQRLKGCPRGLGILGDGCHIDA